jgi:hypothetical protein
VAVKVFEDLPGKLRAFRREVSFLETLSTEIRVIRLLHYELEPEHFL